MAANQNPIFVVAGRVEMCQISTANTNRDGSGTLGVAWTAGANGSRIHKISIVATGATTAGMVRLFISNGANKRMWREVPISAITPSASVEAFRREINLPMESALLLQSGYSLLASTHNGETFNVICEGGDF